MIYSCNPDKYPNSQEPPYLPLAIFDADGKEIDSKWVEAFDTETGGVWRIVHDGNRVATVLQNSETKEEHEIEEGRIYCPAGYEEVVKVRKEFHKPPLSHKPLSKED